jgi:hypothetical protein
LPPSMLGTKSSVATVAASTLLSTCGANACAAIAF